MAYGQDAVAPGVNPALAISLGNRYDVGATVQEWSKQLTIADRPVGIVTFIQSGTFKAKKPINAFPSIGFQWNGERFDGKLMLAPTLAQCIDTA